MPMEVSQPDQLKRFVYFLAVPLRGGTVTDVCTIYYVGIFPMQSVLFRYVHPARRVNSPLSGRKGHVYTDSKILHSSLYGTGINGHLITAKLFFFLTNYLPNQVGSKGY